MLKFVYVTVQITLLALIPGQGVDATCIAKIQPPGPNCDPSNRKAPQGPCAATFVWRPLDLPVRNASTAAGRPFAEVFHTAFLYDATCTGAPFTSGYYCGSDCGTLKTGTGFVCDESQTGYMPLDPAHLFVSEPAQWEFMKLDGLRLYVAELLTQVNYDSCRYPNCKHYSVPGDHTCHNYVQDTMEGADPLLGSATMGYYQICSGVQDSGGSWKYNYCKSADYTCCGTKNTCHVGATRTCCGTGACPATSNVCCSDGLHCCTAEHPICDIAGGACNSRSGDSSIRFEQVMSAPTEGAENSTLGTASIRG